MDVIRNGISMALTQKLGSGLNPACYLSTDGGYVVSLTHSVSYIKVAACVGTDIDRARIIYDSFYAALEASPYIQDIRNKHTKELDKLQAEIDRLKAFETYFEMHHKMIHPG